MYVICFYWQGDRWQQEGFEQNETNLQQRHLRRAGQVSKELPSKYINNLYIGVKRFADRPFKFICFTNESMELHKNIETRKFKQVTGQGVLPRLYMFSKEAGLFGKQVLCIDIDVVITGSLKNIMGYGGLFCARSKFKRGEEHKLDGDVMSFRACAETEHIFWKPFIKDVRVAEELTKGRERYWMRHVAGKIADRWDIHATGEIVSYKRHVQKKGLPENASIVSCHGVPRPHQIKDEWIKEYWK